MEGRLAYSRNDIISKDIGISMPTSVHDSSGMHMFQSTTNLDEVFPDGLLWNQSVLTLEMLQKYNRISTCDLVSFKFPRGIVIRPSQV